MNELKRYCCKHCNKGVENLSFNSINDLSIATYGYCINHLDNNKTKGQIEDEIFIKDIVSIYKKDILEKNACLSFTLFIKDIEELDKEECVPHPHYPFIHGTISSPAKKVSDDVYDISDIRWEDIEPFVNQYVLSDMHNAYCSLTGYDELTKRALDREDSRVLFYEPDELKFMQERGLNEQKPDGYVSFKNVGQLVTKDGDKFIPVQYQEIPAFSFNDWIDKQDDITIIEDDSGDFWHEREKVMQTLEVFKQNPLLWYCMPVSALLDLGVCDGKQKTLTD